MIMSVEVFYKRNKERDTVFEKSLKTAYLFDDYALIICNFKDDTTKVSLSNIEDSDFGDFVKTQKNKSELKRSDYFESGEP